MMNLKNIPYLNGIEGFQILSQNDALLEDVLGYTLPEACSNCIIKSHTNLYSTTCLNDCSTPSSVEKCKACFNTHFPSLIDKTCKNDCNQNILDTLYDENPYKL